MHIEYEHNVFPPTNQLTRLYDSVGWTSYTRDVELLGLALLNSLNVVIAKAGGELVGLARVVGDGLTIVYLQDILVDPRYQRAGIGRELFRRVFEPYGNVRQKVLLTDDEPAQLRFYHAMGFTEIHEISPAVRAFARLGH